jgi:transposase
MPCLVCEGAVMPDPHPWEVRRLARSLRASRLSYEAIAAAVGASKSTVQRWLEGPRKRSSRLRYQRRWQAGHPELHARAQSRHYWRRKLGDL